jgi:hypothetical protein
MSYTVTQENLNKAIEMLAFLNLHVREMEREHGFNVCKYTPYNTQREKLTDETILLSCVLGIEISEIQEMISKCTHEMEKANAQ